MRFWSAIGRLSSRGWATTDGGGKVVRESIGAPSAEESGDRSAEVLDVE